MPTYRFYHPDRATAVHYGKLPHKEQQQICYFVTFMTKDAMPRAARERWQKRRRDWLMMHGFSPDLSREQLLEELSASHIRSFERMFSAAYQKALDGGSGECLLARPDLRQHVIGAIGYHANQTCHLADGVVMPNHVHLLLQPFVGRTLKSILGSIRKYSAGNINTDLGRSGAFWAREPFDHMVRSRRYFERYRQYIRANPKRAKLPAHMYSFIGGGS